MSPKKEREGSATRATTSKKSQGFTAEERAAMKERAAEMKAGNTAAYFESSDWPGPKTLK
jgi:hypothetical protein